MAEIIPFPTLVSDTPLHDHDHEAAGTPSGDSQVDQMLQARARIQKVLDELDRLNGALKTSFAPPGIAG
ncbi:hypothetical protein GGE16_005337 [Rhizobium leguminosarum]|uniref:Uncharacterized protein n=1 Tax=Rhizobium leguminosarum TaxID=384 RepID=A0AAE2MPR0_RHILE|nr:MULTISPECIES: hypothetical protein [Rhizobium]MBB4293252.1 hypothetical protein [Rhizobium leguminosarum]MBB4299925.1 hypothetical protein [Rhizobium leguminosarum]MBB4311051.1 hypothetical protein [Rhizobium leguminosarum]MBB4436650.1 hypothetical protein [Rhizobium esperanzae]MBB4532210.1 hypothetical protein [Rhizobium leguminosarum]